MDNTIFLHSLLHELSHIISPKNLVNELAEILTLEKASVYRRINGKIPFSFFEIALLARKTGISLDKITNRKLSNSKSFILPDINFAIPSTEDHELINEHFDLLAQMKESGNTELTEACNLLPFSLYSKYEYIMRFYTFKWIYQYKAAKVNYFYKDVCIEKELKDSQIRYCNIYKESIQRFHYILDYLLFFYIVNDLKYFAYLHLISPEEILLIKKDLLALLDEIELTSISGCDPETGNEILLYISSINLDTNYVTISSNDSQLVTLKLFLLCSTISLEKDTFEQVKTWLESLKRHSILISGCNEVKCRQYFEKQRLLIDKL